MPVNTTLSNSYTYDWRWTITDVLMFGILALVSQSLYSVAAPYPVIWLPAGYALALLFRRERAALPVVFIGALVAALIAAYFVTPGPLVDPFLVGRLTLYTLVASVICWWGYRRTIQHQSPLLSYTSFLWFLGTLTLACFVATLPTLMNHADTRLDAGTLLLHTWSATFLGALIAAPPIMAVRRTLVIRSLALKPLEAFIWIMAMGFVLLMIWHEPMQALFLLLPLMTWAATRFSLQDAMFAIAVAGLGGLVAALAGLPADSDVARHLLSEALIAMIVAVSCYVRVLLKDRERIENGLEDIVEQRTRELQLTNYELKDEIFVRQQAEKSFRRSSRHYRALFETASNPIIVIDQNITVKQWNSAAETLFGYSRDEAIGRNLTQAFIPPEQRDELAWKILKLLNSGLTQDSLETEIHGFDGSRHFILWNLNRLHEDEDTGHSRLIMIGQDITEIRHTQSQLHYLAHYDVLTDTANRRLFEDRCRQAITSALRHGHQCALIGLDVDHFKRINDTLGHDAGDRLLQELAGRLRGCVREEDTIARLGGDEFAVLLVQVKGAEGSEKVGRTILENLTKPVDVPGGELIITSSIGITIAPDDGQSYEQLLKNADMAMYRAKKAGRNNIQFFSSDMNEEMQRQMTLERELRDAIREGQLDLYYQPVINARSGKIQGVEALLRWRHPTKGLLAPRDFLDVAEQTGQLQPLGEWVCLNACLQARAIQAMSGAPMSIRINLSSRQYNHPKLASQLDQVIKETRLDPGLLLIEIDERILSDRMDETAKTLSRLKGLGVGLVLDRFGSGLSSLRLLRELPFDQVKIDQDLLHLAPHDESTGAIVHTLVNLARQLSLTVAAAGIETADQHAFLRAAGCHLLQGHRFCPALPSSELGELFAKVKDGHGLLPEDQFNLPFSGDSAYRKD